MPGLVSTVAPVVLPGDAISTEDSSDNAVTICGPGVQEVASGSRWLAKNEEEDHQKLIATRYGALKHAGDRWWIAGREKRYIPAKGEPLVGVVTLKGADFYRLDIGTAQHVLLPVLAFEGATRRNRPNLKLGSLVHCKVTATPPDLEATVECFDSASGKSQGFGELKGGYLLTMPGLEADDRRLKIIGDYIPFEIAIGKNGQSWVKASSIMKTIALVNALEKSRDKDDKGLREMVRKMLSNI